MGNESLGPIHDEPDAAPTGLALFFAVGFYKDSAPDGASAAVTSDEAISPFSDEMPTGDNGGNGENNSGSSTFSAE